MPSTISSERGPVRIETADIDADFALLLRVRIRRRRAWRDIGCRNRAEQIADGDIAGFGEILHAEIGHRHADGRGAVNQRSGDQHLLRHRFRSGLGHLALGNLLGLRRQHIGQRQKRYRTHQGCKARRRGIYLTPLACHTGTCCLAVRRTPFTDCLQLHPVTAALTHAAMHVTFAVHGFSVYDIYRCGAAARMGYLSEKDRLAPVRPV